MPEMPGYEGFVSVMTEHPRVNEKTVLTVLKSFEKRVSVVSQNCNSCHKIYQIIQEIVIL